MPWPGAKHWSRVHSAKSVISVAPSACQTAVGRSTESSAEGRQTVPTLQPSVSPSVASTRSHSVWDS